MSQQGTSGSKRLPPEKAIEFLVKSLTEAHDRDVEVGGLFNAYEPVLHYAVFTAALRRQLWEPVQEAPLPKGGKCDVLLPLEGGTSLWVEIKMWWFLHEAYESPYVMQTKTGEWPLGDWEKLDAIRETDQKAVVLMRTWDNEDAKQEADRWLEGLKKMMEGAGASDPICKTLEKATYGGERPHARNGDLIIWTTLPH